MPHDPTPVPPAWADSVATFEIYLAGERYAPKTIAARIYHVSRFARAMPVPPERVNRDHVIAYMAKPSWKAIETYNAVRQHIRAYLVWAWERKVISLDLAPLVPPAKKTARGKATRAAPQAAIEKALATEDPRDRLMVILSLFAGLKPGEIAVVRADDVQEVDGGHLLVARPANGRQRDVLLRPDVAEAIRATPDGYLFPGKVDGHISSAYVSRLLSATLPPGMSARRLRQAFLDSTVRLSWSELASFHSPHAMRISELPDFKDGQAVAHHLARIEAALRNDDPAAAVGSCKELLEAVFKAVLDDAGTAYERDKLPAMFNKVSEVLSTRVAADDVIRSSIRNMMRTLSSVAQNVAEIRNDIGTGHDHRETADPRHARLVFNATVTVVEYVADTWRAFGALEPAQTQGRREFNERWKGSDP